MTTTEITSEFTELKSLNCSTTVHCNDFALTHCFPYSAFSHTRHFYVNARQGKVTPRHIHSILPGGRLSDRTEIRTFRVNAPRRPWFDTGTVRVRFVADKVALGQDFFYQLFSYPLSVPFHHCSISCYPLSVPFHHCSISCYPLSVPFHHCSISCYPLSVPFHHCSISCYPLSVPFHHCSISCYPPSVQFHHCSILISIHMSVLPEEQAGETWKLYTSIFFRKSDHCIQKYFLFTQRSARCLYTLTICTSTCRGDGGPWSQDCQ
jgi:hypothetical protein